MKYPQAKDQNKRIRYQNKRSYVRNRKFKKRAKRTKLSDEILDRKFLKNRKAKIILQSSQINGYLVLLPIR
jgi:hypothetical protein